MTDGLLNAFSLPTHHVSVMDPMCMCMFSLDIWEREIFCRPRKIRPLDVALCLIGHSLDAVLRSPSCLIEHVPCSSMLVFGIDVGIADKPEGSTRSPTSQKY